MDDFAIIQKSTLQQVRALAAKKGIPAQNVRPGIIRLYAQLVPNTDTVRFNSAADAPIVSAAEIRLKRDNFFYANFMALGIQKVPVLNSIERPFNNPVVFYPDITIFGDAAPSANDVTEAQALECVYQGTLNVKTGTTERLQDFATMLFRSVPQTQQAAATRPSHGNIPFQHLGVSFGFSGQKENKFELMLGGVSDRVAIEGGAESNNYAVLLLAGYEIVNGAAPLSAMDNIEDYFAGNR